MPEQFYDYWACPRHESAYEKSEVEEGSCPPHRLDWSHSTNYTPLSLRAEQLTVHKMMNKKPQQELKVQITPKPLYLC